MGKYIGPTSDHAECRATRNLVERHWVYSGHYPRIFVTPRNARNAETKHRSGAVPILLLVIPASTTYTYSSLNVLQGLNPQPQLLEASVYHSATSAVPKNVLFTEAELGCHVLRMCPIQWQDQYNLNKKGMTPMDLRLLLTSLEAIGHVFTQKKANLESSKKASHKGKKGKKNPGTKSTSRVPKKVCFKKHCDLCKKHGGVYTTHNTRDCHRFKKDRKEISDFCAAKKGCKKANPVNQNFAQLSKKLEKLEKALKKLSKKAQNC
jgi:hypothetical protein